MTIASLLAATAAAPGTFGLHLDFGKPGAVPVADALKIILVLTVLAVAPAILIAMSSFTRIIIVLSMIRHGLGMQDTPPNLVLISIAMFLTLFTMSPALEEINSKSLQPLLQKPDRTAGCGHGRIGAAARIHDPADPRERSGTDSGSRTRADP